MKKLLTTLIILSSFSSCVVAQGGADTVRKTIPLVNVPIFLGSDGGVNALTEVSGLTRRYPVNLINKERLDSLAAALAAKANAATLSTHVSDVSNPHSVTKAQVGLANADNTSDVSKPVSTATQAALNLKANADVLNGLTYGPTKNLDFTAANVQTVSLTGNITFTASGMAAGKQKALRVISDASSRTLTFPSGWVWLTDMPTSTNAGKTGILSLYCFGTLETDVIASWVTQGPDL